MLESLWQQQSLQKYKSKQGSGSVTGLTDTWEMLCPVLDSEGQYNN